MPKLFVTAAVLLTTFCASAQFAGMSWSNKPGKWSLDKDKLTVTAEPKTDFWRTTHYRYITDNGHFYYKEHAGDFTATVKITGAYKDLYDQAGLMIRIDSLNWIKSGVEFVNGGVSISAVYTRHFSDWSVISVPNTPVSVWLKLVRQNDGVELSYSLNGKDYAMQRLGYFPPLTKVQIGVMAAAPEGKGFAVTFEDFAIH